MYGWPVPSALFSFPLRGSCSLELLWAPCIAKLAVHPMEPLAKGVSKELLVAVRSLSTVQHAGLQLSAALRRSPGAPLGQDTILNRFEAVLNCTGRSNHSCWPAGLEAENCLLPKPDTLQSWVECSLVEARDPAQRSVQIFPFHVAWYCNILPWF